MCREIHHEGDEIDTVRKMVEVLGWTDPAVHPVYAREGLTTGGLVRRGDGDVCLCPVDIEATAAKYGMKATVSDDDWDWYTLEPA